MTDDDKKVVADGLVLLTSCVLIGPSSQATAKSVLFRLGVMLDISDEVNAALYELADKVKASKEEDIARN